MHIVYDQYDALEECRPLPKLLIISPKLLIISPKMATKLEPQLLRRAWRGAILDEALTEPEPEPEPEPKP